MGWAHRPKYPAAMEGCDGRERGTQRLRTGTWAGKAEGSLLSFQSFSRMEGNKPGAPEGRREEQNGSLAGAALMASCFLLPREALVLMAPLAEMVRLESR